MKLKILVIFIFYLLFSNYLSAQKKNSCNFGIENNANKTNCQDWHFNTLPYQGTFNESVFCVNISVYIIRKSDSIGGVIPSIAIQELTKSIESFENIDINLIYNGEINYIDSTTIHEDPDLVMDETPDTPNTINIYFSNFVHPDEDQRISSYSLTGATQVLIMPYQLHSSTISHELGHQFGLFHTFHATADINTFEEEHDSPDDVAENSFNGAYAGDWVQDTHADNGGLGGISQGELCNEIDDLNPNQIYDYQSENFMTNSYMECRNSFTGGQITRMKFFLNNSTSEECPKLPHLGLAVVDCDPPEICTTDNCKQARKAAKEILFGESSWGTPLRNLLPIQYTEFNSPSNVTFNAFGSANLGSECSFEFYVSYDGGTNFIELPVTGLPATNITSSDNHIILKIKNLDNNRPCCYRIDWETQEPNSNADWQDIEGECPDDVNDCGDCDDLNPNFTFNNTDSDPCVDYFEMYNEGTDCDNMSYLWNIYHANGTDPLFTWEQQSFDDTNFEFSNYPETEFIIEFSLIGGSEECTVTESTTWYTDENCYVDPSPCVDCKSITDPIQSSFSNVGCIASVDIPVIDGCLYGYIQWGDSTVENLVSDSTMNHVYTSSGSYTALVVIYTDGGKYCTRIGHNFNVKCKKSSDPNIKIMPNPSKSNQEVAFNGVDYKDIISIEVFDIYENSKITIKPKRNAFNIGHLPSGIYFVRFTTLDGDFTKKLVIE